jgi:hypothetical protein
MINGYRYNGDIGTLVDSLYLCTKGRKFIFDSSIFDVPIGNLRGIPSEYWDNKLLSRYARFYSEIRPLIPTETTLLSPGVKIELGKQFLELRFALCNGSSPAAHAFASSSEILHRTISSKKKTSANRGLHVVLGNIRIKDRKKQLKIEEVLELCSSVDSEELAIAIDAMLRGEEIGLATRDTPQIYVFKEIADEVRVNPLVVCYHITSQKFKLISQEEFKKLFENYRKARLPN